MLPTMWSTSQAPGAASRCLRATGSKSRRDTWFSARAMNSRKLCRRATTRFSRPGRSRRGGSRTPFGRRKLWIWEASEPYLLSTGHAGRPHRLRRRGPRSGGHRKARRAHAEENPAHRAEIAALISRALISRAVASWAVNLWRQCEWHAYHRRDSRISKVPRGDGLWGQRHYFFQARDQTHYRGDFRPGRFRKRGCSRSGGAVVREPGKPRLLSVLGPGLVTGAADDDPSGIATYSQAGAQFGFQLGWTLTLYLSLDGGDSGSQRADRSHHRSRHRRQCAPALPTVAGLRIGRRAYVRQCLQHRRRFGRHGAKPPDSWCLRSRSWILLACLRSGVRRRPDFHAAQALRRDYSKMADAFRSSPISRFFV